MRSTAFVLALAGLVACPSPPSTPRTIDARLGWRPDVRARLDAFLARYPDGSKRPLAVFDWDNTVMKNDVGDALFYWMVRNDKIEAPEGHDWKKTSRWMTDDAASDLAAACPGDPPATSSNTTCADHLLSIYEDGRTSDGKEAFAGYDHRRIQPSYAWLAALLAGKGPEEVREMARAALGKALDVHPVGATQVVGSKTVVDWARVYPEMRDLIGALQQHGLDVWIVSASPKYVVETVASRVGVAADHVIGIESVEKDGRLTAHLRGCGDVADGDDSVITYVDGKRCFINDAILGIHGAAAFERAPADVRQVFAAGDSDTDVTFVADATGLKVVLDRNKPALLCNAASDAGKRWLVSPMFIEPKKPFLDLYRCSTTACFDAAGKGVPCLDEDGRAIPDQSDPLVGPVVF